MSVESVPSARIHPLNRAPVRTSGAYVLYWMVAARRLGWSFALDQAVAYARALHRPLVILEGLRAGYRWASDRHHAFALNGMREHAETLGGGPVLYHPYVEPEPGAGRGLLAALAREAAVVVTDYYPTFFIPRMQMAVAERFDVRLEAVDGNGLLPLSLTAHPFTAAYHFRRFLQKSLGEQILEMPSVDPLSDGGFPALAETPRALRAGWPAASEALLAAKPKALEALPIDHAVPPVPYSGGHTAARARLDAFIANGLARYGEEHNHPDADAASGLSPWLHWGHISAHEVFREVAAAESWSPARLSSGTDGKREGWWGMSASAELFLDELVTWRELGYVYAHHERRHDQYDTLPEWARRTLAGHASDPRPSLYDREAFEEARTHDEIWNAAQRELRGAGVIHNYLRMLWGKKILEWSASPREVLRTMVELNNRWAVDGRDPNSWSGIFWVLGRFDRGWPERAIYGKIRSMSSDATRRKVRLDGYLKRWGSGDT